MFLEDVRLPLDVVGQSKHLDNNYDATNNDNNQSNTYNSKEGSDLTLT